MDKFRNKYRIQSARLQTWDYSSAGAYFITICTAGRAHYFGNIENGHMKLTEMGKIAETEWLKTFEMRPDMNLLMGPWVVMPNHFHAIICIGDNQYNTQTQPVGLSLGGNVGGNVETHCIASLRANDITKNHNQFGPQSKNLASIVRGFKTAVTTGARKIHANFAWQSRFHDHIIRNNAEYQRISNYIESNPAHWEDDKFFNSETSE